MKIRPEGAELSHTNGRIYGRTDGQTDRQTDGHTDGQTDGRTYGRTDRHVAANSRSSQFCEGAKNRLYLV